VTGRVWRVAGILARLAAGAFAIANVARGARRVRPLAAEDVDAGASIEVIVPARDEAGRIGPLLDRIVGAPGVGAVLVVDDESSDATAGVARRHGATVVAGQPLPPGWVGKAWALDQGLRAASSDWVVFLDADTRPDPELPRALVRRAAGDGLDLVSGAGRFECPTAGSAWLHPAMLTTLVYRYGPPGAEHPGRLLANGQCMTCRREQLIAAGGWAPVAGQVVEDVAVARHLARRGWRVGFLDAADLLTVRMYESFGDAWRGWGRSLALSGVEPPGRQVRDLAVVVSAQVLPLVRLIVRRGDALDVVLAVVRLGTLAGTARAYHRRGVAYWTSPAADTVAALAVARGIVARRHRWRGRVYGGARRGREPEADQGHQHTGRRGPGG
jgi:dolichol-phosphate mannosyltransferase